jgi:hypothetical protein
MPTILELSPVIFEGKQTKLKWQIVQTVKDRLLASCDWTQLPNAILSPTEKTAWGVYRETLQKIPFDFASPDDVVFPDPPVVMSTPITPAIVSARLRKANARINAAKVIEVKNLTANQAETWLRQQVHGADTESSINASIDSAVDIPALKVILKKINKMSYARTKSDKVIMELLIALRDEIMPDL